MAKRTPPTITPDTPTGNDVDLDREDIRLPDGTRLTQDVAEAIVADVRRGGGRPSLTGEAAVSPRVTFRVAPAIRNRAAELAEREGKSISQFAREALEARVKAS